MVRRIRVLVRPRRIRVVHACAEIRIAEVLILMIQPEDVAPLFDDWPGDGSALAGEDIAVNQEQQ